MKAAELERVRPGFEDASLSSQAVFRVALQALSHPGRVLEMPAVSDWPHNSQGAAALLLLALVDSDCKVWLSPQLAHSDAATWLRFHTGCQWAEGPQNARFLWVAQGDELPRLASLESGSDAYPDQSATCVLEVSSLDEAPSGDRPHWLLRGPGIAGQQDLTVRGGPGDFVSQWSANHQAFPRGVDVFFATGTHLAGLPRTTAVSHFEPES